MNKKEKERTWTHLSPISEDAGGYGYGSARDDSFLGFLKGCWLVDLPLGNGKLAKVLLSFLPYTFAGSEHLIQLLMSSPYRIALRSTLPD